MQLYTYTHMLNIEEPDDCWLPLTYSYHIYIYTYTVSHTHTYIYAALYPYSHAEYWGTWRLLATGLGRVSSSQCDRQRLACVPSDVLYMYVCMHIYTYIYIYILVSRWQTTFRICLFGCSICVCVCVCVCVCLCVCVCMYAYIHTYIHIYIYIYIYTCIYTYYIYRHVSLGNLGILSLTLVRMCAYTSHPVTQASWRNGMCNIQTYTRIPSK
jgi:hypothetical protein